MMRRKINATHERHLPSIQSSAENIIILFEEGATISRMHKRMSYDYESNEYERGHTDVA
jgi:hypothetical protein